MVLKSKKRVLLLAEMANPEWPSVPLLGWQNAVYLRKVANTHLVTQVRNKNAIEKQGWREGKEFTSIDSEAIARGAHKLSTWLGAKNGKGWTTSTALASLSYYYFEYLVWKVFGDRIKAGEYDVVHRVTPVSPTSQSTLAAKCAEYGVPMIIGPLNGGVRWPKGFDQVRRNEREWLSYIRSVYRLMPGYHSTLRDSSCLLVGSKDTLSDIPLKYHDKCIYFPENGVDKSKFSGRSTTWTSGPIRTIFVGRLVPYKGVDMLLEALAPLIADEKIVLDVVGDGPMMAELRSLAVHLNIAELVTFHGNVTHSNVSKFLAESHIFCFPSIREFGGGVVLEAMATGVVPIVVDYGGPAELVDSKVGIKIPIGSRALIIKNLQLAVQEICNNPEKLENMSAACLDSVAAHHTWDVKANKISEIYDWVVDKTSNTKPISYY